MRETLAFVLVVGDASSDDRLVATYVDVLGRIHLHCEDIARTKVLASLVVAPVTFDALLARWTQGLEAGDARIAERALAYVCAARDSVRAPDIGRMFFAIPRFAAGARA